ncbi:DUF3850 domain-containing protein [Enterococcus sp. BWB1-3]|nr:DUF3850 domain-containing protein [Enterococcus sp. BWB1-3]
MEEYKGDYRTPYHSMRTAAELENNVGDWLHDNDTTEQDIKNQEKYLQAWLTGNYTAKQEQKYQILKLHVDYFDAVAKGIKTFEIRKNDRNYQIGNILVLREYDPIDSHTGEFTGRECRVRVTCMTDYEQKPGYVVLGIVLVKEDKK